MKVRGPGVATGRSGSIGNVFFVQEDFWPLNTSLYVRDFHGNDERFIFYLLRRLDLARFASGTGVPTLNRNHISEEPVLVPPLEEQRRIVKVLDEAFAAIATATANAEKNLANARELLLSIVTEAFGDDSLPSKPLGEVAEVIMGQSPPGNTYNTNGIGTPLINGPDEFGGREPFAQTVATKFTTHPTKLCHRGDALVCVRGSTTGRMNLAGQDACIGRGVAAVRSAADQGWINHFLRFNREVIYRLGSGATFPNVSSSDLKMLRVPMPSQAERDRLLAKLETADSLIQRLIDGSARKTVLLRNLEQSLLHGAFSDELTQREPIAV